MEQIILLCFVFMTSLAWSDSVIEVKPVVELLKEARSKFQPRDLTLEEKKIYLDQAELALTKIYVNKESKKALYGFDPESSFLELKKNLEKTSTDEFHSKMLAIFNASKDYHVNYYLPPPHYCYSVKLPFNFYLAKNNKYIVRKIFDELKLFSPELGKLSLADEILSYDGQKLHEKVAEISTLVNASTDPSRKRAAEVYLTWRDVAAEEIPVNNEVILKVKKSNGEIVTVKLPWIAEGDRECLDKASKANSEKNSSSVKSKLSFNSGLNREEKLKRYLKSTEKQWGIIKDNLQIKFSRFHSFKEDYVDLKDVKKTSDEDLHWKTFNFEGKEIAYLKMSSFNTYDMEAVNAAMRVKEIIKNYFSNTHALIIDLRSNLGGQIDFAEYVASMLHPNPLKAFPFMVRSNEDTLPLFLGENGWQKLIEEGLGEDKLVGPGRISDYNEQQLFSQVYFGKVALITNAYCFSSCEIFAAAMKDFAGAKIYGLHKTTFGGGANVWDSQYFNEAYERNNLPIKHPKFLSFRATVRNGIRPSDKTFIDDVGVKSDYVLPLETQEIINPNYSSVVYQIAKDLVTTQFLHKSSDYEIKEVRQLERTADSFEMSGEYHADNIDLIQIYRNKKYIGEFQRNKKNKFLIKFNDDFSSENKKVLTYSFYGFEKNLMGKKLRNRLNTFLVISTSDEEKKE